MQIVPGEIIKAKMSTLSQLTVEVEGKLESLFRALRPLEDLLCPVHPEEPVHLALVHQLNLKFEGRILSLTSTGYNHNWL